MVVLTACPSAKLTSLFVRNYSNSPMTLKLSGDNFSLFEDGKFATSVKGIVKNSKLKMGVCAEGDSLSITAENNSNLLILPANSTTEIIFPTYKILKISSSLTIETESQGIKKSYFSNQFDEIVKSRKDIFYMDLMN